jgi:hypothetical protein
LSNSTPGLLAILAAHRWLGAKWQIDRAQSGVDQAPP